MASTNKFEIGPWGMVKNEIIEQYASAYTTIFKAQGWAHTCYVDVFAGAPYNTLRGTEQSVPGSAIRALGITNKFDEYWFVDVDDVKASELEAVCKTHNSARVHRGDGNSFVRDNLIPRLSSNSRLRSLILIDPYGMEISWDVVSSLGRIGHSDVIINFPTMDINRNALRTKIEAVSEEQAVRMDNLWGDRTWQDMFYQTKAQLPLFGDERISEKAATNKMVVDAYCERLRTMAGFNHVSEPVGFRNSTNSVMYYILLASPKEVATNIMRDIQKKYG